jgi:hypothetical protein
LRDRETGSLSIERGASYPVADWEYLVGSITTGRARREGWWYLYDDNTQVGIFFGEFPDKRKVGQ